MTGTDMWLWAAAGVGIAFGIVLALLWMGSKISILEARIAFMQTEVDRVAVWRTDMSLRIGDMADAVERMKDDDTKVASLATAIGQTVTPIKRSRPARKASE